MTAGVLIPNVLLLAYIYIYLVTQKCDLKVLFERMKASFERSVCNFQIAELKGSVSAKDSFYKQELEEVRTRADRDVWELRRKLQKLDDSSYDKVQALEDKHRDELGTLLSEKTYRHQ